MDHYNQETLNIQTIRKCVCGKTGPHFIDAGLEAGKTILFDPISVVVEPGLQAQLGGCRARL